MQLARCVVLASSTRPTLLIAADIEEGRRGGGWAWGGRKVKNKNRETTENASTKYEYSVIFVCRIAVQSLCQRRVRSSDAMRTIVDSAYVHRRCEYVVDKTSTAVAVGCILIPAKETSV